MKNPSIEKLEKTTQVTTQWIEKGMKEKMIKQNEISLLTGISKTNISSWISGKRPMSKVVKAMFYFMILYFGKEEREYAKKRAKYLKAAKSVNNENSKL